jgi:hypothetical protein
MRAAMAQAQSASDRAEMQPQRPDGREGLSVHARAFRSHDTAPRMLLLTTDAELAQRV